MGFLDMFRMGRYEAAIQAAATDAGPAYFQDPSTFPIASPFTTSDLNRIVADDVFGGVPVNTRSAAMQIPAVARARNRLCSSIARNPLVAVRRAVPVDPQPSWMWNAGNTSPQLRVAWTVDDLIFTGWSCWWRVNGADGFPVAAGRIPRDEWTINDDQRVEVNGQPVADDAVIVIPGMHEGVLSLGYTALCDIRTLYANVRKRLRNPIPGIDLHQTGGTRLTDTEIDALIARWAAARAGDNGGVSYTSEDIEAKPMSGGDDGQLMIESRNAAAVDIARMIGVSASVIDATAPKASLNYETTAGRNAEFIDTDLPLYTDPIAWRLSLDDVVPHGQSVAFDTTAYTAPDLPDTGPALED